jgi:cytochrome c
MDSLMTKKTISAAACGLALLLAGTRLSAAKPGDANKGKEVFEQCSVCHNSDSEERKMGPGLKGLFKREKLVNGKPVNEANVRALINAGGNGMPSFMDLLSDDEREDVIAFLKTL